MLCSPDNSEYWGTSASWWPARFPFDQCLVYIVSPSSTRWNCFVFLYSSKSHPFTKKKNKNLKNKNKTSPPPTTLLRVMSYFQGSVSLVLFLFFCFVCCCFLGSLLLRVPEANFSWCPVSNRYLTTLQLLMESSAPLKAWTYNSRWHRVSVSLRQMLLKNHVFFVCHFVWNCLI